jgi:drug/metabolite transporter superfamily protein YnfA
MANPPRLRLPSTAFMQCAMANAILSIGMLAGFALLWGAWRLWKRDGLVQKAWLMAAAALVIFANIAIWTVPDKQGRTLATEQGVSQ